jgi:hypothetical protein
MAEDSGQVHIGRRETVADPVKLRLQFEAVLLEYIELVLRSKICLRVIAGRRDWDRACRVQRSLRD